MQLKIVQFLKINKAFFLFDFQQLEVFRLPGLQKRPI